MPNSVPIAQAFTKTGAMVRLFDGNLWPHLREQHGPGLMLTIDMPQPGDGRHSEVYVDGDAVEDIFAAIEEWLKGPAR